MKLSVFSKTRPFWVALVAPLGALLLSLFAAQAFAVPTFPDLNGQRVVDDAHLLSDATKQDLTLKLKGLEDATTDQVVIVTVPDLQGNEIEDYGYQLGRHWGIGQKDGGPQASNGQTYKDNGILLIVAPNERKVRIEVGYGLEGILTDALSSQIIRNAITPRFKAGDMPGGIAAGVDQITTLLALPPEEAKARAAAAETEARSADRGGSAILGLWPIAFIILFIAMRLMSRGSGGGGGKRYRRGGSSMPIILWGPGAGGSGWGSGGGSSWGGGGGFGGGGGGFSGGGSFGGGGASGGW